MILKKKLLGDLKANWQTNIYRIWGCQAARCPHFIDSARFFERATVMALYYQGTQESSQQY